MEAKNTLNGFEAILDTLNPHVGTKTKTEDNDTDVIDAAAEELTDEELEALRNPKPKKTTKVEDDELEDEDNEEEDEDEGGNKNLIVIIPMVEMIQAMKK